MLNLTVFFLSQIMRQFKVLAEYELEPAYVMGHRLVSFLVNALPQHPDYNRIGLTIQRQQCQSDLAWIRNRLEVIALKIDEEKLNDFMDSQFDPQVLAESGSVSSQEDEQEEDEGRWESFSGWECSENTKVPAMMESDASSCDWTRDTCTSSESETETEPEFHFDIEETFPDPEPSVNEDDDDDDSTVESDDSPSRYFLNEPVLATPFLKKIACEDVRYETDSDAMDSWAQDDDSLVLSASSGTGLVCDPARIAFRELMNKMPRSKALSRSPPTSPPRRIVRKPSSTDTRYAFDEYDELAVSQELGAIEL